MGNKTDKPVLLLVDIQKGLDDWPYYGGERNNLNAEANAQRLLQFWRTKQWPVVHVRHSSKNSKSPLHDTKPGFSIKTEVTPQNHETVITKQENSAFIGTGLERLLKDQGSSKVVIVGLTTNHCVSSTARMAGNLDFDTYVIADATAAFTIKGIDGTIFSAATVHDVSLANLNKEFATILTTEVILQQW